MIKRLKIDIPTIVESVSYTTRPQRPGEVHGLSYFFISREEFIAKRDNNEFLEWAEVHGNFYGTSKEFVENCLKEGKHVLFDLDVQGTDAMKLHFQDVANVIFISPPSVEELEKRLRHRGTENTEVINLRLMNARKELLRKEDFDYLIYNDDIENAYSRLKEITQKILQG
jgi:guanylate kinase